jgi:K+-transporting ATPase KdpF subunit
MTVTHALLGCLCLGLFGYLLYALIRAEDF